jgi:SAM-dependent methyltransferase
MKPSDLEKPKPEEALEFYQRREADFPLLYRKIKKHLSFFADRKAILELGCGEGDFLELARRKGLKAEGIDLDPGCAEACRGRGLKAKAQDAVKALAASRGRHDAVFCSNVVEHLEPKALCALFDAAARSLPKGGKLGLNTANPRALGIHADAFWHDLTHVRLYPAPLLRSLLEARGFEVTAAGPDEDTRRQSPLLGLARLLRRALLGDFYGPPEIYVMAVKR